MIDELPDVPVERAEFFLYFFHLLSVDYGCGDLLFVSYDACIAHEAFDLFFAVTGYLFMVKLIECFFKIGSLVDDGVPTEAGLKCIEYEIFEEHTIGMFRYTPFCIVVFDHEGIVIYPRTSVWHRYCRSQDI